MTDWKPIFPESRGMVLSGFQSWMCIKITHRASYNRESLPSTPEFLIQKVSVGDWERTFLTSPQVMLMLLFLGPHFENHWFRHGDLVKMQIMFLHIWCGDWDAAVPISSLVILVLFVQGPCFKKVQIVPRWFICTLKLVRHCCTWPLQVSSLEVLHLCSVWMESITLCSHIYSCSYLFVHQP